MSKGIGYIATDCRPWVVVVDGWMYGRQLSAAIDRIEELVIPDSHFDLCIS